MLFLHCLALLVNKLAANVEQMSARRACLCLQERERWKEWVCVPCWATLSSPHLDNGPGVQETRRQQLDSTISEGAGGAGPFCVGFAGPSWTDPHGFSLASSHRLTGHWLWMVGPMMIWPLIQGVTPPAPIHKGNVFRRMDECDKIELHYVLWNLIKLEQPLVYFPPWIFFGKTT